MKLWQPFTQHAVTPPPPVVARAEGAYLHLTDGRKLFDGISSWWVATHGHSHPVIHAAIAAQSEKLSQTIFANFTHDAANEFIDELSRVVDPKFARVFLSDSGSTAIEVAINMVVGTWYHRGQPQRHKIIAFDHAYHGDTVGAASVGARSVFTRHGEPLLFEVLRVPSPANDPARCLEVLQQTLHAHENEIAAVIVEPLVQGAGGMKMYSPAVLDDITRTAHAHGAFVIFDEVMTGFGRTGTMFAYQQCCELPDIIALAKGITGGFLPMAATLATQEIFDAFCSTDRARQLFYSTSYTGNALACAAAAANLRVWREENTLEKITVINAWHQKFLPRLAVRNPRICGVISAFEIDGADNNYLAGIGAELYQFCMTRGIFIRPLGNTAYLLPPYCTTESDLEHCYDAIAEFLNRAEILAA
jgi:adenosylmethionine-8-amino-7-oxononanoate aminotransferase